MDTCITMLFLGTAYIVLRKFGKAQKLWTHLACLLIMLPLTVPDCAVAVEAVAVTGAFSVISISSGPAAAAAPFLAVT